MNWKLVDANDQILGRLATSIANDLMGKDLVTFAYNTVAHNKVVVTNADKIKMTGKKLTDKTYYRHTGFPGGIKETTLERRMQKDSTKVLIDAVKGMLPKNKLQKERLNNLYVYAGTSHPHEAQINAKNN